MTKPPKRPRDPNQLAKHIVDIATGEAAEPQPKSEARARAGTEGAKARAQKLSADERKRIAQKAAEARWGNKD